MTEKTDPPLISETLENGVLTLRLGRAPAHPLSLAMIEALHAALLDATENDSVGAIVIHGEGRIFCAGHDLKEIAACRSAPDHGKAFLGELFGRCGEMMQAITGSPKATIAMVEGIATAAGLQLVAACDLAYASPEATFCLPGVKNHGFCTTPAVAVARSISRKHVMELALSGDARDANWALASGLINSIVPQNELRGVVQEMAASIATRNLGAIARGKAALYAELDMPLAEAYAHATEVMVGHFMDESRIAHEQEKWT